jgi:hypothetical protein
MSAAFTVSLSLSFNMSWGGGDWSCSAFLQQWEMSSVVSIYDLKKQIFHFYPRFTPVQKNVSDFYFQRRFCAILITVPHIKSTEATRTEWEWGYIRLASGGGGVTRNEPRMGNGCFHFKFLVVSKRIQKRHLSLHTIAFRIHNHHTTFPSKLHNSAS